MSGTSLDGIDAVIAEVSPHQTHLVAQHYLAYPKDLRLQLLNLHHNQVDELHLAALAAQQLAYLYATAVNDMLMQAGRDKTRIRAIGCHGQTLRHRPESGYTIQIGNAALLAELTGITVVADFRSRDIAAGGQGAPLVPAFHAARFRDLHRHRVIANLGGIANLTNLPRTGSVTGFDTGPGNVLLDAWAHESLGRDFDRGGKLAARGKPVASLLKALLADPYFRRPPPKSTGRSRFNLRWLYRFGTKRHKPEDVQATLAELTARSIGNAVTRFCPGAEEVYLCGGGARNADLVNRLARALGGIAVGSTDQLGIHPDWVEAAAFAWLAQRALKHETGSIAEVTGADAARVLGAIYAA